MLNNEMRSRLYSILSPIVAKEETEKKERAANVALEKSYLKIARKKKRKTTTSKHDIT